MFRGGLVKIGRCGTVSIEKKKPIHRFNELDVHVEKGEKNIHIKIQLCTSQFASCFVIHVHIARVRKCVEQEKIFDVRNNI